MGFIYTSLLYDNKTYKIDNLNNKIFQKLYEIRNIL